MRTGLLVQDTITVPAKQSRPHVVILPSAYPTFHSPVDGIFVQEQVSALHAGGLRAAVVYPDLRSLRTLRAGRFLHSRFQIEARPERGIETVRVSGWNVPLFNLGPRLWKALALRGFAAYMKGFGKPDLCHAHNSLWAGVAAREIKKRFGVPYVLTEHSSAYARNLVSRHDQELTRQVFAEASAVVAVSNWLRVGLQRYGAKEIRVVPNTVDTDFFTLPPIPRKKRPFRFLTVALLTPVKGVDLLIHAFQKSFWDRPEVELEVAGDGPERPRLQELARGLGASGKIVFSGLRTREQVRESMWRSNVFVTASHTETFGLVLAEALATGLPVISTKCGGPEEIVTPDVGMLVQAGAVDALAEALTKTTRDHNGYDPDHLRQSVLRRYAPAVVSSALLEVYQAALC